MDTAGLYLVAAPAGETDWQRVQRYKLGYMALAARHAIQHQKTDAAPEVALALSGAQAEGKGLSVAQETGGTLALAFENILTEEKGRAEGCVRIHLPGPVDMRAHSGLAVLVDGVRIIAP